MLEKFLDTFQEDVSSVQLALLTAIVKLFIRKPSVGQKLIPRLLKMATEDVDNPDLRDRGFMYWRLLSTDPLAAKAILFPDRPPISGDVENLDPAVLEELLLNLSTLASLYHRPPGTLIGGVKPRMILHNEAYVDRSIPRGSRGQL